MNASHKPPDGLPRSVGVLAKYVLAYARASNLAEGRVRAWISYMITAGMLERTATTGQPPFVIKGGVALELRLRNRARATKDLDVSLHHPDADLALTLEHALTGEPYQGFSFRPWSSTTGIYAKPAKMFSNPEEPTLGHLRSTCPSTGSSPLID